MGNRVRIRLASIIGLTFLMTACGGGDDGPAPTSNAPQPPPVEGGSPTPPSGDDTAAEAKNTPPTIDGTPPPAVLPDTEYVFEPAAQDADGDLLFFSIANAPPWAKFEQTTGRLAGKPGAGDIGTYENIVISVTDGAADAALEAFGITVSAVGDGSMELSWIAPTENEDGTPLTDLAGYKIYWGTESGNYTDSVTIDNPSVVTYVLDNLVSNTYYFVATAVNAEGEESEFSEEAVGTVS